MQMKMPQSIQCLLFGIGLAALALFAYSSGYDVGKDIAVKERTIH